MTTAKSSQKRSSSADAGPKRKRKRLQPEEDDADLDLQAGLNTAFGRMDSQLLADHLAQKTSRWGSDLSSIELADLHISADDIKDTTAWEKPRTLGNLPEFLETFTDDPKSLSKAPKQKGAPHTIVVTAAGLRAAELVRTLRKFQTKESPVTKLAQFAKHIKFSEAVSFLENHRTGVAVGTPQRLIDLLDNSALSANQLKRIVVDASHIDVKKRGIMDMKDTMMPLAKWLSREEFKERYSDPKSTVDLMFY